MSCSPSGDHRGRSSDALLATTDRRSIPSTDITSMSNPLDVTTLKASRDPSKDQDGFRPLMGCGKRPSSPVSGSTARSCGGPLRVVANPIREPSGDHCGLSSSPGNRRADAPENRRHS